MPNHFYRKSPLSRRICRRVSPVAVAIVLLWLVVSESHSQSILPPSEFGPNEIGLPALDTSGPNLPTAAPSFADRLPEVENFFSTDPLNRGADRPSICDHWHSRPFSVGWGIGLIQGSAPIHNWVDQNTGIFSTVRLGWDHGNDWGCEMRFSYGTSTLSDSRRAIATQRAIDEALGLDELIRTRDATRHAGLFVWDVALLYYLWGDEVWRPYITAGLGLSHISFSDRLSQPYSEGLLTLPIGFGVKYRWKERVIVRLELTNQMSLGSGSLDSMHHFAMTAGLEIRFGRRRMSYWPWSRRRKTIAYW